MSCYSCALSLVAEKTNMIRQSSFDFESVAKKKKKKNKNKNKKVLIFESYIYSSPLTKNGNLELLTYFLVTNGVLIRNV